MQKIEVYDIKNTLYVNTKFLSAYFRKSEKQISRYKAQGMPLVEQKPIELNKVGNWFDLNTCIDWVEKNVNKTKSNNSKGLDSGNNASEIDLSDEEKLFEIYTKGNVSEKTRLLLRLDQNTLDNFKKMEDIIEKQSKNKAYDSKYAEVEKVKIAQQELARMFISFLKTSMPVLSKDLENKVQDEIYHILDAHYSKEITKINKYIHIKDDVNICLNDIIVKIIDVAHDGDVTHQKLIEHIDKVK